MRATREELVRISPLWGEMAFEALAYLEKTDGDVERATRAGQPVSDHLRAARQSAMRNLEAALYSVPRLREAIGPASPGVAR